MSVSSFERSSRVGELEKWNKELLDKIERGEVKEIPVKMIALDKEALEFKDDALIKRLIDSYKRRKMFLGYPIVQKGTNVCIDGTNRVLAAKELGLESMTVRIVDVSEEDLAAIRLDGNIHRRVGKKELYHYIKKAETWGWDQKVIASFFGLSQGRISQIKKAGDAGWPKPELVSKVGESGQAAGKSISSGNVDESGVQREGAGPAFRPDSLPDASEWTLDTVRQFESHVNSYIRTVAKLVQDNPDRRTWLESAYTFIKDALGYDK